jgi:hypothetical protein
VDKRVSPEGTAQGSRARLSPAPGSSNLDVPTSLPLLTFSSEIAMSSAGTKAAVVCSGCGESVAGKYCPNCGEKTEHHPYSLSHLFEEFIHTLTHADSAILRTLVTLFRQPGELTRVHFEGPRRKYIGPVRFFIICNVIFFVLQAALGMSVFRATFDSQTHGQFYQHLIRDRGRQFLNRAKSDEEKRELKAEYDRHSEHLSKSLIIVLVPVFALAIATIFMGKHRYYVEHLVFSFGCFAFFLLCMPLCHLLFHGAVWLLYLAALALHGAAGVFGFLQYITRPLVRDVMTSILLLGGLTAYLYASLGRYYRLGRLSALWRAVTLGALVIPMVVLYRWMLFYVSIWTM